MPVPIATEGGVVVAPAKDSTPTTANDTAVLHRSTHDRPSKVISASGTHVKLQHAGSSTTQDFLDSSGGAAVACLGHAHPRVLAAMRAQLEQVCYAHTLLFTSEPAEQLGALLAASTDGQLSRALFVSSGSEAIEAALKLARQHFLELPTPQPGRVNFIARQQSYHGITLGALAVSGHVARRKLFEPVLARNVGRVSACNEYRGLRQGETVAAYVARLEAELESEFQRLGPDTVCGVLVEPVVGAALGCVPPSEGYLAMLRRVCQKHGALLIFDEVMCGMGRTGTLHAWEQEGVVPDIQTIGKGLGGGYMPIAGILINRSVVDVLDAGTGAFSHGHTYQGHPLACTAALEVQRVIRDENLMTNVRAQGALLGKLLHQSLDGHDHVGNVRGRGLFWGIEFVADKATKRPYPAAAMVAAGVHKLALQPQYSLSLYPGTASAEGFDGDHVLLAPAYNVGEDEIRHMVSLTTRVIEEYFRDMAPSS